MLLALLASCVDPVTYGAVPDDHGDDAPAFQRAIDQAIEQHAEVCIGPGVWNLARPSGRLGSVGLTGGPIAIHGAGPATVLRMSGPGHHHDWRAISVRNAHDVVIRDLTIDGLDAFDTEEQTHLIELGPGTHDVVITNVTLGPMRRPDQRVGDGIGGDCLRLLGEPGREVADVTVVDSRFVDCDRSGVGVQRALRDITLAHDTITGAGDTAIDFEPTGRGAITDVTFVDLTIQHPPLAQSAWAITLAGIGQDLARRVLIEQSTMEGGGVSMLNVDNVELADNLITAHPKAGPKPTITVFRRGTNIRILRNTIARPAAADPGFVIRASHNNGEVPHGLVIEDNTIEQATRHPVIGSISVGGLVVRHNVIKYTAGDPSIPIVQASAVVADVDGLTVEDNDVRGAASALVTASVRKDHTFTAMTLSGNRTDHLAAVHCSGPRARFSRIRSDQSLLDTGCQETDARSSAPAASPSAPVESPVLPRVTP
jgi:hypothetical protein